MTMLGDGTCKETTDAVYFYTPTFYALDNFSAHTVRIWGTSFPTAEHAFQWKKFELVRSDIAQQILEASSPNLAKKLAIANKAVRVSNWKDIKVGVMEEILRAKHQQHEKVQRVLQDTGARAIYENSPDDDFWGIGADGAGKNVLGELWMKIRNG